jgi:hypothetical protein
MGNIASYVDLTSSLPEDIKWAATRRLREE